MRKTIKDIDFPDITKITYLKLNGLYGTNARIVNMFEMFQKAYDIQEFVVFDPRLCQNGPFESWLMDRQLDWMNGKPVDFKDVYEAILTAGEFTENERRIFELGHAEERLWAIFLTVCDPLNKNNI